MGTEFHWCSGAADIAAPCPAGLAGDQGLEPFFRAPNAEEWGDALTRWLYHECLHFWQLASSRYLQTMVVEEWDRVLAFERDGKLPPGSGCWNDFGRTSANEPFSVRDLVECLARFWDVHTRSPTRLLREEGEDLEGRLAEIDAIRPGGGYSGVEYDAVMLGGRDCEVYAKPYRWMLDRATAAPAVGDMPESVEAAASWAANLLLPIAGFLALNTEAPIAAFVAAFDRALLPDALGAAAARRDRRRAINIDWLDFWSFLAHGLSKSLKREGLSPWLGRWVGFGVLENPAFLNHPVYRHLRSRMTSLDEALKSFRMRFVFNPPNPESENIDEAMLARELEVVAPDRWPVFSLPGQPYFRLLLGAMFAPPLVRFDDTEISAAASAPADWPWPIDAAALARAVDEAEFRLAALHDADAAVRFGLPPNAFARVRNSGHKAALSTIS